MNALEMGALALVIFLGSMAINAGITAKRRSA